MSAAKVNRAEILRDACIVTTASIASHPRLANEFALATMLSKLAGRALSLVTWPNGITAMVDAEPGTQGWDDLLFNTYLAGLQNRRGPVFGG
jgi:hypothetical protein